MPSELETAMESLINVFHRYASKEGRSGTLNRRELRELMENELSNFLMVRKHQNSESKIIVSRIIISLKHVIQLLLMPSSHSFFNPVSEGPCCCRQNHEGPGYQRWWPGGLWGVCFSGGWTLHCLWAMLSDAHEEDGKEVKKRQQNRREETKKHFNFCKDNFVH